MNKKMSTVKCTLCKKTLEADHTKIALRFNENGDPEFYHKACAKKKSLSTGSTGRPPKAESELQGKCIHLKLSQENKKLLMERTKEIGKPSLGQLMKDAAFEYMLSRTKEDVPRKEKWSHPGTDDSFMLKLSEKAKDEIVAFLAPSGLALNTFFFHVAMDYANKALRSKKKVNPTPTPQRGAREI